MRRDDGKVSTLDLVGAGLTLLTGPSGRVLWSEAVAELGLPVPVEVHGVDAHAADVLGIGEEGAALVRPDAVAVAAWRAPDPAALTCAIADLTAPLPVTI